MIGDKLYVKQRRVVQAVIDAFEAGYENVLLDAPTGTGKTVIGKAVAEWYSDAWYITPQIVLLDQIERDPMMEGVKVLKGKSHYRCERNPKITVEDAGDLCRDCHVECEYRRRKEEVRVSRIGATSFMYAVYDGLRDGGMGSRELLIVDEADDVEGWIVGLGSFRFKDVKERLEEWEDVKRWLRDTRNRVMAMLPDIKEEKTRRKMMRLIVRIGLLLDRSEKKRWAWRLENGVLEIRPIEVGESLNELLWWRGRKRLFMSATIIDRKMFCKIAGLSLKKTKMIRVGSDFPVENRIVEFRPCGKMTWNEREKSYAKVVDEIRKIMREHEGEKGVIHAHSYEIAKRIKEGLGEKVVMHTSKDRGEVFERYLNGDVRVMVAVGFSRGVDLKDELCRWQVITKVPYPDVKDIRVAEMLNRKRWDWYRYQAIVNLVQACGRGVRSRDDWCKTYILDSSFEHLFRYKKSFPSWFVEAVRKA